MNLLARELNEELKRESVVVYELLSRFGREIFFPKGILSQSREARDKGSEYNATLGIATEEGRPIYLESILDQLPKLEVKNILPYAPVAGKENLRHRWKKELFRKNPGLAEGISNPIVTSGLTHGLSLMGDMFVDVGDAILLADKFWGNYRLIYEVRYRGEIITYPLYNEKNGFNLEAFESRLEELFAQKDKVIVLFNFPGNPTGYTLLDEEGDALKELLLKYAKKGKKLVVITDDAYFGLVYKAGVMQESFFSKVAGAHENLFCIKLDGGTKEDYVWGFRVGFLTFGIGGAGGRREKIYNILEQKVKGAIRAGISSVSNLSQEVLLNAFESKNYIEEKGNKYKLLKGRAEELFRIVENTKYNKAWKAYNFNSGYFMCLRLNGGVKAEELRQHLLAKYSVGVIASGKEDIRIAFSCIEKERLGKLFEILYQGVCDLRGLG